MNAKKLLSLSALAFAGAVCAQTVPPEEWAGAPIPTTANSFSRAAVKADQAASAALAQAPQELRVGPGDAGPGAVSRAEIKADLNLWIKSGLVQVANQDSFDPSNPAYRRQMETYQRLRNGPEFVAEVQRVEGTIANSGRRYSFAQFDTSVK